MDRVVAVVGATGLVGREMLRTLAARRFPARHVVALASARSAGTRVAYGEHEILVEQAAPERFDGVDIAIFSAGREVSRELAPQAVVRGCIVIDNSNAWRMDPDVPLVVPEVNALAANRRPKGIIASPNCSTIQMVVALKPIHDLSPIRHVVVSTYQAASGKGYAALQELAEQERMLACGEPVRCTVFPAPLAQNVIMDWKPASMDYSEEEMKMVNETRKIFDDPGLGVSPTTVRVPVHTGHSESLHVRCVGPVRAEDVKQALSAAPGVRLDARPYGPGQHPQPAECVGQDWVLVGRVRDDLAVPGAINLWVVADNLRKGAALNAVQIAEQLIR